MNPAYLLHYSTDGSASQKSLTQWGIYRIYILQQIVHAMIFVPKVCMFCFLFQNVQYTNFAIKSVISVLFITNVTAWCINANKIPRCAFCKKCLHVILFVPKCAVHAFCNQMLCVCILYQKCAWLLQFCLVKRWAAHIFATKLCILGLLSQRCVYFAFLCQKCTAHAFGTKSVTSVLLIKMWQFDAFVPTKYPGVPKCTVNEFCNIVDLARKVCILCFLPKMCSVCILQ